jgi:hypothetical protein
MAKKKKKEEAEEDHLELSEEEMEEERQDAAARLIQTAYRRKMARDMLKVMIRQNFVKMKDRDTGLYFYKNRTTGETMVRKPRILGDGDLPAPRDFKSPKDYDPGFADMDGFALIVTVNTFMNERLPNLGAQAEADHAMFEHLLGHDYICKISAENVVSLKNPSVTSFKDSLERLRKMVKKRGFLFVYICTHVVTIETKVVKDDCFFCFRDTVWKSSDQAATSSISLSEMCHLINVLGVDRKVIAVNFAHAKATPKSIFKSRYIYPPPSALTRMADMCNCAVLGSCNVGTSIPEMQEHTPTGQLTSQRRGALKIGSSAAGSGSKDMGKLPAVAPGKDSSENSGSFRNRGDDIQHVAVMAKREMAADIVAQYQKQWMDGTEKTAENMTLQKPKQPGLKWRKETPEPEDSQPREAEDKAAAKKEGEEKVNPEEDGKETKKKKNDVAPPKKKKKKKKTEEEAKAEKDAKEAKLNEAAIKSLDEKEEDAANDLGIKIALPSSKEVRGHLPRLCIACVLYCVNAELFVSTENEVSFGCGDVGHEKSRSASN